MKELQSGVFAALLAGLVIAVSIPAVAADPPTIWSLAGIPQGIQKIQDSLINFKGKHPKWERKPPLKRIADPANLEAEMPPAIKAAAEIKIDQDMEAQKIKAIKFLATVGCGCYQDKVDVRGALVEALADCTEDVRYEAAMALCQVAGSACRQCDTSCCNAETMQTLNKMAYGQDESGCYYESSAKARAAAESALNACRQKFPTTPGPLIEGGPKEAAPAIAPKAKPKEAMLLPKPRPLNKVGVNSSGLRQPARLVSDIQAVNGTQVADDLREVSIAPAEKPKEAMSLPNPSLLNKVGVNCSGLRQPAQLVSDIQVASIPLEVSIKQPLSTMANFGGTRRYDAIPVVMHREIEHVANLQPSPEAE